MFKNKERREYTKKHKRAYLIIEHMLTGKNTLSGYLHDVDKLILYPFFEYKKVHKWHREHSKHHTVKAKTFEDYLAMVIDWECARFTKSDKPLNAYDTLYKYYPELEDKILPILANLNLAKSGTNWLDNHRDFILERIAA